MKNYTYHFEIQTLIEQFVSAFNDIVVKRYENNVEASEVPVRFIYAPQQRVIETLSNPAPGGVKLPVVAVTLGGITRDQTRVYNKNLGFHIPSTSPYLDESYLKKIPPPVPVDITVNFSILAKYQQDMDQILSNFIPYCDPYVMISWKFPNPDNSLIEHELRSEVRWSGSVEISYPTDLAGNVAHRISAQTSFVIKGWLFKKMEDLVKKIYYINADFVATPVTTRLLNLEYLQNNTERVSLSAQPRIRNVYPHVLSISGSSHLPYLELYGKYFFAPSAVFLSGSTPGMFNNLELVTHFNNTSSVSSYPSFSGVRVPNFEFVSENLITLSMSQSPQTSGFCDVIVLNEAGYGKLTTGSYNPNLFLPEDQLPSISGIEIKKIY